MYNDFMPVYYLYIAVVETNWKGMCLIPLRITGNNLHVTNNKFLKYAKTQKFYGWKIYWWLYLEKKKGCIEYKLR